MEKYARYSVEWGEKIVASTAGGKDPKTPNEYHQKGHHNQIQKHHEVEYPKEFLTSLNKNNTIGPCLDYKII